MKIYKVNILKIGILSLFLAGALIASLTGAINETAHIQQLNNQEGYTNKTIQKMYEGSLAVCADKDGDKDKFKRKIEKKRKISSHREVERERTVRAMM